MSDEHNNHRVRYILCTVVFLIIAVVLAVAGFWIPAAIVLVIALAFLGDARYANKKMAVNQQTAERYGDAEPVKHNAKGRAKALELAMQEASINAEKKSNRSNGSSSDAGTDKPKDGDKAQKTAEADKSRKVEETSETDQTSETGKAEDVVESSGN